MCNGHSLAFEPKQGCCCSLSYWKSFKRVVLLTVDVDYHYHPTQLCLEFVRRCQSVGVAYDIFVVIGTPSFNEVHPSTSVDGTTAQRTEIQRNSHDQVLRRLVSVNKGDLTTYISDLDNITCFFNGGMKIGLNQHLTSSKLKGTDDYTHFFQITFQDTPTTPHCKDQKDYTIRKVHYLQNDTQGNPQIVSDLVMLSNHTHQQFLARFSADMSPDVLFNRVLCTKIESLHPSLKMPLALALYFEVVNSAFYSMSQVVMSSTSKWKWNKGEFESIKNSIYNALTGHTGVDLMFRKTFFDYQNLIDSFLNGLKNGAKVIGFILAITIGITIAYHNPTFIPLALSFADYLNILTKLLDWSTPFTPDERRLALYTQSPSLSVSQFVAITRNPNGFRIPLSSKTSFTHEYKLPSFFLSESFEKTQLPYTIRLNEYFPFCEICHDLELSHKCEHCGASLCVCHNSFHTCAKSIPLPYPSATRLSKLNYGPMDFVASTFSHTISPHDLSVLEFATGSGNFLMIKGKAFFLGGTYSSSSLMFCFLRDRILVYRVRSAYGIGSYAFGGVNRSIKYIKNEMIPEYNEYLNGSCFDHSLGKVNTYYKSSYPRSSCIWCNKLNVMDAIRVPRMKNGKTKVRVSWGLDNIPYHKTTSKAHLTSAQESRIVTARLQRSSRTDYVFARYLRHGLFHTETPVKSGDCIRLRGNDVMCLIVAQCYSDCVFRAGPGVAYVASCTCNFKSTDTPWREYLNQQAQLPPCSFSSTSVSSVIFSYDHTSFAFSDTNLPTETPLLQKIFSSPIDPLSCITTHSVTVNASCTLDNELTALETIKLDLQDPEYRCDKGVIGLALAHMLKDAGFDPSTGHTLKHLAEELKKEHKDFMNAEKEKKDLDQDYEIVEMTLFEFMYQKYMQLKVNHPQPRQGIPDRETNRRIAMEKFDSPFNEEDTQLEQLPLKSGYYLASNVTFQEFLSTALIDPTASQQFNVDIEFQSALDVLRECNYHLILVEERSTNISFDTSTIFHTMHGFSSFVHSSAAELMQKENFDLENLRKDKENYQRSLVQAQQLYNIEVQRITQLSSLAQNLTVRNAGLEEDYNRELAVLQTNLNAVKTEINRITEESKQQVLKDMADKVKAQDDALDRERQQHKETLQKERESQENQLHIEAEVKRQQVDESIKVQKENQEKLNKVVNDLNEEKAKLEAENAAVAQTMNRAKSEFIEESKKFLTPTTNLQYDFNPNHFVGSQDRFVVVDRSWVFSTELAEFVTKYECSVRSTMDDKHTNLLIAYKWPLNTRRMPKLANKFYTPIWTAHHNYIQSCLIYGSEISNRFIEKCYQYDNTEKMGERMCANPPQSFEVLTSPSMDKVSLNFNNLEQLIHRTNTVEGLEKSHFSSISSNIHAELRDLRHTDHSSRMRTLTNMVTRIIDLDIEYICSPELMKPENNLIKLMLIEGLIKIFVSYSSRPMSIYVLWVDGAGAVGKTSKFVELAKESEFFDSQLISKVAASAIAGNTYQKALLNRKGILFADEAALFSIEELCAYSFLSSNVDSPVVTLSDTSQLFGLGNHKKSGTSIHMHHIYRNQTKIGVIDQEDNSILTTHRSHGPLAQWNMDRLYNDPNTIWAKIYGPNRRRVVCKRSGAELSVIPYPDNENLNIPCDYRITGKKMNGWVTIRKVQGDTARHGVIVFLEPWTGWSEKNDYSFRLWVVALTRATTLLWMNSSAYYSFYQDPRYIFADSPFVAKYLIPTGRVDTKENKALNEIYQPLLVDTNYFPNEYKAEIKYDNIAKSLIHTLSNKKFSRVIDLTPAEGRLLKSVGDALKIHERIAANRRTWKAFIENKEWTVKTSISNKFRDALIIIDAPTRPVPKNNNGDEEWIQHEFLMKYIKDIIEKFHCHVVYKSSLPDAIGTEIACNSVDVKLKRYVSEEWYLHASPEEHEPTICGAKMSRAVIVDMVNLIKLQALPVQKELPDHSWYEIWSLDPVFGKHDTINYNKFEFLETDQVTQRSQHPTREETFIGTIHWHEAHESDAASVPDFDMRIMNVNYNTAHHYIAKRGSGTARCFHCDHVLNYVVDPSYGAVTNAPKVRSAQFSGPEKQLIGDHIVERTKRNDNFPTDQDGYVVPALTTNYDLPIDMPPNVQIKREIFKDPYKQRYTHVSPAPALDCVTPVNYNSSTHNALVGVTNRLIAGAPMNFWLTVMFAAEFMKTMEWLESRGAIPDMKRETQGHFDWEALIDPWIKRKPVHRAALYRRNKNNINMGKIRKAKMFIKSEKLDDPYKVPRVIVSIDDACQLLLGPMCDSLAKKWVEFQKRSRNEDGSYPADMLLFTMGLTGEELAEDMLNRPTNHCGDMGKFDRSIHWLFKLQKIIYILAIITGAPELIKLAVSLSIYCVIIMADFVVRLFGKTFSGDWDTLWGNTIILIMLLFTALRLSSNPHTGGRVIGDDSNLNITPEQNAALSFFLTFFGLDYAASFTPPHMQNYNSQIAMRDTKNRPYTVIEKPSRALKTFFVPYEFQEAKPRRDYNKFEHMVSMNMNYVNRHSGDPVIRKLGQLLTERFGDVKIAPTQYRDKILRKPYKTINMFEHEMSESSFEIYAHEIYKMSPSNLRDLISKIDLDNSDTMKKLVAPTEEHRHNFHLDRSYSMFSAYMRIPAGEIA